MWVKLILALAVVLLIVGGMSLMNGDETESKKQAEAQQKEFFVRAATDVVMYEKRLDTHTNFIIRARTVTENSDRTFAMENFSLNRSDGLKMSGNRARYDAEVSKLKVIGPMTVTTADGWKADLADVVWNRQSKYAVTNKPVLVRGGRETLRANQAEFFDDFNRIQLSGDVHANVSQNLFFD